MSDNEKKQPGDEKQPIAEKKNENVSLLAKDVIFRLPFALVGIVAAYALVPQLASLQEAQEAIESKKSKDSKESSSKQQESQETPGTPQPTSLQKVMQGVVQDREAEVAQYITATIPADYFLGLIRASRIDEIYLALQRDEMFLIRQDENGNTFLHHIALEAFRNEYNFLDLVFNDYIVDFAIKNKQGKTPLELVAYYGERLLQWQDEYSLNLLHETQFNFSNFILPRFIQEAAKRHFDFSSLPYINGFTFLQCVLMDPYSVVKDAIIKNARNDNVACLLKSVPHLDINAFSEAGGTAFYYAVREIEENITYLDEAILLLDHGADPTLFLDPAYSPIPELEAVLSKIVGHVDHLKRMAQEQEEQTEGEEGEREQLIEEIEMFEVAVTEVRKLQDRVREYARNKEVKRAVSLSASPSTTTSSVSTLGSPLPSPSRAKVSLFSSSSESARSESKGEKADAELTQHLKESGRAELEKPEENGASQSESVGNETQQEEMGSRPSIKGAGSSDDS